ncbi:hypothetical protein [Candidatus Hepatoplasma crinochetorum]|uniref:hypothetical protein n=1 Tax=Candidatus Hepatoplasma crinochetorum TaxID=295596 RepID=UPI00308504C9|nr:MAG: hypothetical protein HCTKY_5270 [Candidatus Hepatoplasma crinochetorum]
MKSFFKIFLILSFFIFLNKNTIELNKNLNDDNINYQNNELNDYSEYSNNSITSQQFINDLKSISHDGGVYELQHNVDFSNSENDDVTGIELNGITIYGNGYTLYNRDITEIFNTDTFEVSKENNGLEYYSFFREINNCVFYDLNFDNFMLPFGNVNISYFENVNFYNTNYENLIFNIKSPNINDKFSNNGGDSNLININISTIGLIIQTSLDTEFCNCCFENINFLNNEILLYDENISTVVSLIGNYTIGGEGRFNSDFKNIYINDISFINNQFISEINNDFFFENEEQEKYFSIFYSPFIGSINNSDTSKDSYNWNITNWEQIIFNNINVSENSNNFSNYTFYSLLPPISMYVTFYGKNIYGFNLNLDVESQLNNNENIGIGNLESPNYYNEDNFYWTGIYQTNWINDVYYQNIALDYTSFSDNESMIEQISQNNYNYSEFEDWWYYNKLNYNQDYSLVLADKPKIVYQSDDFYDQDEETINFRFRLIDGRYNSIYSNSLNYYSNYDLNLINKNNNEIIWSGYVEDISWRDSNEFEISIDSNLLFENSLYFEISNDYHTWKQSVDFRKYLPEIYNVSNMIESNNLIVSYDFIDPYNLINSINISLYDSLNNEIESKKIDHNNLENNNYLDSEEVIFDTKIDDPNYYYLEFEVNCNLNKFDDPNIIIRSLDNNLIQYNENNYIQFRTESIVPPHNNESISWWIIFLIVIFSLVLISLFTFLIYYFQKNNKN